MKKSLYILAAAVLAIFSSCSKEDNKGGLTGQWNLTGAELHDRTESTKSIIIGDATIDIYIDFKADGSYDMYQMIGQGRYKYYTGIYNVSGDKVTGNYREANKIRDWGNAYTFKVKGDQLTMTATINSTDVYTYTKCSIPAEVVEQAMQGN